MLSGMAHRPGHLPSFPYTGFYRYFLTFTTDFRQPLFASAAAVDLTLLQFRRVVSEEQFAILAYCFMPDHVHLLLEATAEDSSLLRCQRKLKQLSGYYYKRRFGRALWQPDGYEHVVRDDEATSAIVRYILENPAKAGLVNSVTDYPFAGSDVFALSDILEFLQCPDSWDPDNTRATRS